MRDPLRIDDAVPACLEHLAVGVGADAVFVLEHVVSVAVEGIAVLFSNVQLSVSAFGGKKTTDSVSREESFAII